MRTKVLIGDKEILLYQDEDGELVIVSDIHFDITLRNMGLPGICGPHLHYDTRKLVKNTHEQELDTAQCPPQNRDKAMV